MKKRGIAILLAGIMAAALPVNAFASSGNGDTGVAYVSLGADLNQEERATVLNLLGISESDLENYTVTTVTNAEEHEYLDSYLSSSIIGSRALSSVLVEGKEDGSTTNCSPGTSSR